MDTFLRAAGMSDRDLLLLAHANALYERAYEKQQVIMSGDDEEDLAAVLLQGTAFLESINLENQRRILECYEPRDVFRKKCFPNVESRSYYVASRKPCRVLFVHENRLEMSGQPGLALKAFLEERSLAVSGQRAYLHLDILGQRTLRQKLLSYFSFCVRRQNAEDFTLPFSLTDCADYLAVDRSAMMRELKKMKEEGLVEIQGRRVRLHR